MKANRNKSILVRIVFLLVIASLLVYLNTSFFNPKENFRITQPIHFEPNLHNSKVSNLQTVVLSEIWEYLKAIFTTTWNGLKTSWNGLKTFFGIIKVAIQPLYTLLKALKWFVNLFN